MLWVDPFFGLTPFLQQTIVEPLTSSRRVFANSCEF